jgi:hypothetical protein
MNTRDGRVTLALYFVSQNILSDCVKPLSAGMSRHYFDLFQLARQEIGRQALAVERDPTGRNEAKQTETKRNGKTSRKKGRKQPPSS